MTERLHVSVRRHGADHPRRATFGEALDITCRLVDAPELKCFLANTTAPLALVVSDDIYRSIIRHGYDDIDGRDFNPTVRVEIAGLAYPGWVQAPTTNPPTTRRLRHRQIAD